MDRANICHTTFRLPSLLHDERKFIESEPIGTIVPFPDWMLRKLAAALPGTGVIGLNGPLGSGKRVLWKQASTFPVREHSLYTFLERADLHSHPEWTRS